jgi:hypothetical protein
MSMLQNGKISWHVSNKKILINQIIIVYNNSLEREWNALLNSSNKMENENFCDKNLAYNLENTTNWQKKQSAKVPPKHKNSIYFVDQGN